MGGMFEGATSFNGDISSWDVSSVGNMGGMFEGATSFNGDISSWDVSSITSMKSMFEGATSFNGDISSWRVSRVKRMSYMFKDATSFNGDISSWDVSSVSDVQGMFDGATSFNGDISSWDMNSVRRMASMFRDATSFNGDISSWGLINALSMAFMFEGATSFDGDISSWDVGSVTDMDGMFNNSGLSTENYDKTLIGWSQLDLQSGITLGAISTNYCNGAEARRNIIDNFGWTIADAGKDCTTASITDLEKNLFTISPNPTIDFLFISDIKKPLSISIYNLLGKEVLSSITTGSVNVKSLAKGIYVIRINEGLKEIRKKFIKN
jgi:surface protein